MKEKNSQTEADNNMQKKPGGKNTKYKGGFYNGYDWYRICITRRNRCNRLYRIYVTLLQVKNPTRYTGISEEKAPLTLL